MRSLTYVTTGAPLGDGQASEDLLQLWLANRHAVVILLDRGDGTPHAAFGARFVSRLVKLTVDELRRQRPDQPISREARQVLEVVFDNTRRALATRISSGASARCSPRSVSYPRAARVARGRGRTTRISDAKAPDGLRVVRRSLR